MSKITYLDELRKYLEQKSVSVKDVETVISDYSELYDEATDLGIDDMSVAEKLGNPKDIFIAIKDTLHFKKNNDNKMVAISPFISVMLFFGIGFGLEGWSYAWLVFLLRPLTAIWTSEKGKEKIIGSSPFVAVIIFFALGFIGNLWHPGWLIFLIVPFVAIVLDDKGKDKLIGLSVFIIIPTFILIGTYVSPTFYEYGWAMFAITPILALILNPMKVKEVVMLLAILLAVAGQLTIYFMTGDVTYTWYPYILPIALALLFGYIDIVNVAKLNFKEKAWVAIAILLVVVAYLTVSLLIPNVWGWSWIILLLIPMIGVYDSSKFKSPVAYMPFISVITFMILGTFFNLWYIAWMVFLLIPMTAILTGSEDKPKNIDVDESSEA
jgi:uncharacterized membrane protein